VRHLLTHTAGVPEWVHPTRMVNSGWFGESFALGERLPTLAEYYRGGLRLAVEPGTICTYSDHGFATLGQIVQDVSGQPLERYLREHIFRPLGMANSDLLRSAQIQAHLATGYRLGPNGAKALTDRQWVTSAASSIYSTPRDMARYVAALLGDGVGEHGAILKPETLAVMFRAHYRTDPRIPGMGLGFFRVDLGGHAVVEHQGVLPGFNSQIFLAPDDGVGVLAFTNGSRNAATWLTAETQRLLGDLIGAPTAVIGRRTAAPGDLGRPVRLVQPSGPADRYASLVRARRGSAGPRPSGVEGSCNRGIQAFPISNGSDIPGRAHGTVLMLASVPLIFTAGQ